MSGTVKSANGEPIIGANVKVTGTTIGCITDLDGNFTLDVPEDGQLTVSYIGFQTLEVPIGEKSSLSVVLKEDMEMLDEVVVVGRSSERESNNTIQSPNLQHFNIFGKIPEPLNQPYAKFTNFR